ncbi:MAG TPA: TRAM domain-containing protein [Candidatus Omnitrophota bacterium]|nr:TRAM domain-containing protein [Candidatus Omnitrophota bacterium]
MTIAFIRALFIMISSVVGYYIGFLLRQPILGAQIGCLSGLFLIFLEQSLSKISVRGLSSMVFGLLLGVFMAKLLADILSLLPLGAFVLSVSRIVLTLIFSYLGAVMALRGKDEFNVIIPYVRFQRHSMREQVILLDTSAIIDGRIMNIYKTNFISGRLVIPKFVLMELQRLADSEDDIKRQRGRRGIELLHRMQHDPKMNIRIHEGAPIEEEGVDAKLISLAKLMDASLCTTDYNLSQVAALQNVEVLNIHDLVNSVKPPVYVGEQLDVQLVKEGKEAHQAVAYMDDGTMVVVNNAQHKIGQTVKVKVGTVLQTQAGKMIFADFV